MPSRSVANIAHQSFGQLTDGRGKAFLAHLRPDRG